MRVILGLLISLLLWPLPALARDVMLQIGLTREQFRLEAPALDDDAALLQAGVEVCSAYDRQFAIPPFYCLSQLRFRVDGQVHVPAGWESNLAGALRTEMLTSDWLLERLGTDAAALQALSLDEFVRTFPEHPERAPVLKAWLASRAAQLQQRLQSTRRPP